MNLIIYYDIFIFIANLDLDFVSIIKSSDNFLKQEVLNYIDFLKKKPTKKEFFEYKISKNALNIYMQIVSELVKKTK